ncbi:MarR family winged helix-turn-helix transcriptional regulator [Acetobacter thailandicus]|uniref:MarR family winged helix-turn-helix transcriptional regulator n=1 Tax=Acetobacter thailandicus TaxID=1502842 RepID=UPI001BA88EFE|nr:MarR family transcriptional regulator [Acetobacter thailandicus]MBS0986248.1 MarR family transcriptional regulator [Acetobacter thailandicus]
MHNGSENTITLGRMLNQTARLWRHILNIRLLPYGLTDATWQPLLELKRQNRPMHQKDIAEALFLDKSSVVRTLRNLEQQGLITRVPDKNDRRAHYIVITDEGNKRIEYVLKIASEVENEVIQKLSDHKNFRPLLEEVYSVVKDISGHYRI